MRYFILLLVSALLFSCKENTDISPSSLTGTTWSLIASREHFMLTGKPTDFVWKSFERQTSGGITYQFLTDSIIEKDYPCSFCYRSIITHSAKYGRTDMDLKIQLTTNNELLVIYGNNHNNIVRLTKDTLVIGKSNLGLGEDYSEFKFVRVK